MTYQVDLSKSGEELLLGLINYDNNPLNIPHQDLWPKVVTFDGTNLVPGSKLVAPEYPWTVTDGGSAVDMVVKKEIPFETNTCIVKIRGNDASRIYVDGVGYAGNNNKDHMATVEIPVEPGMRTVAIWVLNDETTGGATFSIHDGETLRAVSDESWGYVTPIQNGIVKERYVKEGWRELKPEDILYVRPPVSVPDGAYVKRGTLTFAEIGTPYELSNHAYKLWRNADIYPLNPANGSNYLKADPSAKYIWIESIGNPPANTEEAFIREIFCETGSVEFTGSFDDSAVLYIDGVQQSGVFNSQLNTMQYTLQPGTHKFAVVIKEGPGGTAFHGNWAIKDNGKLIAVSDTQWKAAVVGSTVFNNALSEVIVNIPNGYVNTFTLTTDGVVLPKEHITTTTNPDGSKLEVHLIELRGEDWEWVSDFKMANPPKNTITTVVTTDPVYEVKEVKVHYDRIGIDKLFSLSGLSVREINLDVEDGGAIVLNQKVLDEFNRRYGVNFSIADFDLIYDQNGYTLKASENSVAFNGEMLFDIIRSLTSRVPKVNLTGFTAENTAS